MMKLGISTTLVVCGTMVLMAGMVSRSYADEMPKSTDPAADADSTTQPNTSVKPVVRISVAEARGQAKLLHEALHGTLLVMHRDFFREDEGLKIPSLSLEDVFSELEENQGVTLRWMSVDTPPMNVDHKPESEFDLEAVRVIRSGKTSYESIVEDRYHHAGRIRLAASCLSCHLSRRSNNDPRSAALVISIPIIAPEKK